MVVNGNPHLNKVAYHVRLEHFLCVSVSSNLSLVLRTKEAFHELPASMKSM